MPNKLRISDHIEFVSDGNHRSNIEGNPQPVRIHLHDHFTNITLDSNVWASAVPGTADTIAISEVAGGECLITTGTADNDSCMLSSAIVFAANKEAVIEVKVLITDVSGTAVYVGFSDAKSESNGKIAISYPDDVLDTEATNAAGLVIDADHATSSIMCASVIADTDKTPVDTGTDWADGETKTLRVELDVDGNATFYLDGVAVGYIASAITATTLLCATVQAMTRAADGANTVRIQRIDVWCNE